MFICTLFLPSNKTQYCVSLIRPGSNFADHYRWLHGLSGGMGPRIIIYVTDWHFVLIRWNNINIKTDNSFKKYRFIADSFLRNMKTVWITNA
jgi:hypothetical protein